jgi:hypothetical protein
MTEVRSFEEVVAGITQGAPALATCSQEVKAAQIAMIHERVEWLKAEPDEQMKSFWKGMVLGEINLLSRLELISQHECMVLRNLLYTAMGEREPHGKQDLNIALHLDKSGIRLR